MGLLPWRKRRRTPNPMDEVVRPALRLLPDPSGLVIDDLTPLPYAWIHLDQTGREAVLAGQTQRLADGPGAATAWAAHLRGAALLAAALPGGPEWSEGLDLQVTALGSGYRDVIAMAAWQLSIALGHAGEEFAPAAVGYARIAKALGAPTPLLPLALELLAQPGEHDGAGAIA
ncbi:MAG: hypothetical protein ACKOE2_06315, partial [Actinomycetales bacterium]